MPEAREELQRFLREDELRDVVLLVLANKQDLPTALSAAEVTHRLGLHAFQPTHKWHVQACTAITGEGLYEGMDWLATHVPAA